MTKAIACFAIVALLFLSSLGNFWFTYGLWPQSWISFGLFWVTGLILHGMLTAVTKD